ncbi:MAG: PQQ-dependent sugar dehydrogenase [Thermoleophilia bacterium]|nr:PQQ-dependent sugar dehydrogenase [Thermoleophilia bacterium]
MRTLLEMGRGLAALSLAVAVAGLAAGPASAALRLARVAGGFSQPVHASSTPSEPARIYVVEQRGLVKLVQSGRVRSTPFLDLRSAVSCCGERGLLSFVFHPRYPAVRRAYANFTDRAGDTRVVQYRVNAERTRALRSTARVLLRIRQPYANHNGGGLAFGPRGFLYVATGDGGSAGDPGNRAQSRRSRLGKLLRVNVATGAVRIVALGLRNPWRFSFDRATGRMWIGDVGQGSREEVDVFRPGAPGLENFGWRRFEGSALYSPGTRLAARTRYVPPVSQYGHFGGRCSLTGGYVYRGPIAGARGRYFFGDYCTGEVWSFVRRNGRTTDRRAHPRLAVPGHLSSFGERADGQLLFVSHGGTLYRLAPA